MKIGNRDITLRELARPANDKKVSGSLRTKLFNGGRAAAVIADALQRPKAKRDEGAGRQNHNYAPDWAPQVKLVDPSRVFVPATDVFGLRSYKPLTRSYDNVLSQEQRAASRDESGPKGYSQSPRWSPQVQLVDPARQFITNTNVSGLRSFSPITFGYDDVLRQKQQEALRDKRGSDDWYQSLIGLITTLIPYQNPQKTKAVQINSPTNPAQAAARGDQSALGYDRKQYGLMTSHMPTQAQTRAMQQQEHSAESPIKQQNRDAAHAAHAQRIDRWFAEGQKGPPPQFQSAGSMLETHNTSPLNVPTAPPPNAGL